MRDGRSAVASLSSGVLSGVRLLMRRVGFDLVPVARGTDIPADLKDIDLIRAVRDRTMTSPERVYAVVNAVEYLVKRGVVGDFVECGVWRGGSMMAMAGTLLALDSTERDLWLYDTFDGMAAPSAADRDYAGRTAESLLAGEPPAEGRSVWARASLGDVEEGMESTGYPPARVHYVAGKVEDTVPATVPEKIALLRLDTDWYESTRHELEHLFPRLVEGGVLILDDYGHWQGARRAVDDYFAGHPLLLNRIDYTGRIAVKTSWDRGRPGPEGVDELRT